jgi:hypothetical protein
MDKGTNLTYRLISLPLRKKTLSLKFVFLTSFTCFWAASSASPELIVKSNFVLSSILKFIQSSSVLFKVHPSELTTLVVEAHVVVDVGLNSLSVSLYHILAVGGYPFVFTFIFEDVDARCAGRFIRYSSYPRDSKYRAMPYLLFSISTG